MKKVRRLWMPLLLGVLLIATLVGAAVARPNARPLEQAWRVLAVGAHDCIPRNDDEEWNHHGDYLVCDLGECRFVCPLNFPAAGEQAVGAVNVKRFSMYAYDNNSALGRNAWADIRKLYPPTGGEMLMANLSTVAAAATDPQSVVDTTIQNNPVYRVQSPYMELGISSANIRVYGFFVHYTW